MAPKDYYDKTESSDEAGIDDRDKRPFDTHLDETERALEYLGMTVDQLESRLTPILQPEHASETNEKEKLNDYPQSPVLRRSHGHLKTVRQLTQKLRGMADRLDV